MNKEPSRLDVLQGTLDLLVLKTLSAMGPLHGYGIAWRIEQVSGDLLALNQGTLYPALLRLERRAGSVRTGVSAITTGAPGSTSSPGRGSGNLLRRLTGSAARWQVGVCL